MKNIIRSISKQQSFTLTELVLGIAVLSAMFLVLTTLYFTAFTFTNSSSVELIVTNDMKREYTFIANDYKNATTDVISDYAMSVILHNGTGVNYEYKQSEKILYRNNKPFISNLEEFNFVEESPQLLKVHMVFKKKDVSVTPPDLYIYRRH